MMAQSVQLPDGSWFPLREGEDPREALQEASRLYPEAFGRKEPAKPKQDTSGFKAAAAAGLESLKGETALTAGKLGILDANEAERIYREKQKAAQERFTPTQEGWTEAPLQKFKETLGGSLPYMAAPAAAGLAALAAPVTAPVAAGLGLLGAGAVSTGQFTGTNLARQMDTGKTLEQTSGAAALGAAIPQAVLDTAAMALLPGVGKLFGSVGSKLTTEQAKAIASQTLGKTVADYAAKTGTAMTREGLTEATQQALERLQAGLSITDPEARKEYIDSFIGGAALAGAGAPIGRAFERSAAKTQAEEAARQEKLAAARTQAEAQQAAAAQEAERKNSPEYALEVGQQYDALLGQYNDLRSKLHKAPKGQELTPAQRFENRETQQALKETKAKLDAVAPDYSRTAAVRNTVLAERQQAEAAAAEKARVEALSPEEYAAEQAGQPPQTTVAKAQPVEGDPFATVQPVEVVQNYAQEIARLADDRMASFPQAGLNRVTEYVQYALRDPIMADQMVKNGVSVPGLNRRENAAFLGGLDLQLKDIKKRFQADLAQKNAARIQALESEEAEAGANAPLPDTSLAPGVGSEIMALRRIASQPAGLSDKFGALGRFEPPPAGSAAIGQMQQKLTGQDVTYTAEDEQAAPRQRGEQAQFDLRFSPTETPTAKIAQEAITRDRLADKINYVLSVFDLSPESVQFLQRAEKVLPQRDTDGYYDLLNQQLDRILSGQEGVPRKGARRTAELQAFPAQGARAATAAPTEASQADIEKYRSAKPGQARSVGQMAQADALRRREEGVGGPIGGFVYQPQEDTRAAFESKETPVTKRVTDTGRDTLRGPSAAPAELSLARELNEPLLLQERAADEGMRRVERQRVIGENEDGTPITRDVVTQENAQKSLFEDDSVKTTRAAFQTYMKSPKVEALRKELNRDREILKRAEQIPALEKRVRELIDEVDGILQQYAEAREAKDVLKANKDVAKAKVDIAKVREAAGRSVVNRMLLAGRLQALQDYETSLIAEGRALGESVEPALMEELDSVRSAIKDAQNDLALLEGAMSMLDGQMKAFTAAQKIANSPKGIKQNERVGKALTELDETRNQLDVLRSEYKELQDRLNKEALERKQQQAAAERMRREKIAEQGRIKPIDEAINNLPAYEAATQYPALTEAQKLAREKGVASRLTKVETEKISGKSLGGIQSEVTRLEKELKKAQDAARERLRAQIVGPKQKAYDALLAKYQAAKTSDERAAIGPKLDVVMRLLARAEKQLANTNPVWPGMSKAIKNLAKVYNKLELTQDLVDKGELEVAPPPEIQRRVKPTPADKIEASQRTTRDAETRAAAPKTSGEGLTRSEAAKAAKPQKTQYSNKGNVAQVREEIANEILERNIAERAAIEAERKQAVEAARAKRAAGKTLNPFENILLFKEDGALFRTTGGGAKGVPADSLNRLVSRVTQTWANAPEIEVVQSFSELPDQIKAQAIADKVQDVIPGLYDPNTKKVYLVADHTVNAADAIATLAHEATGHFGLREMFGAAMGAEMDRLYQGNKDVREKADAKLKESPNLSRQVAVEEVLAEMAEADPNAKAPGILRRVYNVVKALIKRLTGETVSDKDVQQIVANARRFVIEGGKAAEGTAEAKPVYRTKKSTGVATPAMDAMASKILEGEKSWREKMGKSPMLELEMQAADMRAGLREALKKGDEQPFTQAMYAVLKSDQKMPLVYTTLSNGPLKLYKDEKGLFGITSANQNSGTEVFKAVSDLPVAADNKMAVAQMYMVAQRALNKGLPKLDLGGLGVTEADLKAVLAEADANPALKTGLENVRRIYNAYNKGLIDFNVQTGAIPKALGDKLNEAGDYVPFYRVDANGNASLVFDNDVMVSIGDIRRQPYLAELKGGETKLLPLDEAIFRNTTLLVDKALTNMATKEVAYGLQAIGKSADKMKIQKGEGPANARVIRFTQEPDPRDSKDDGKRWLMVDTEGTLAEGVPNELLVKSLEGAHLPLPSFLKMAGAASDLLRAGVTRMPPYILRQLLRDPMAAAFTGGLNYTPFRAVAKAGKQYVSSMRGSNALEAKLVEKGLIQSGIFTGDADDISKIAKQIVGKDNMGAMDRIFSALDKAAIKADAATRALVYENALKNGLSEVEADMMTMESMNFYKRGLSPSVQYAARLIPFLNAQIQGLNVLYKAATGKMPFEQQQQIKRKFFNNAALLVATGIVYAMAMEDDETFKNARPRDKYSNFFLPTPFTDEPIKLPIPYEAGYFFSLAVAAVDGMKEETRTKEQFQALRDLFLGSIPGYSSAFVPQIVKPIAEVWTNKNFMSGAPIESARLQGLDPVERYNTSTTEFAKLLSKAIPVLSPIQIEHIARGYMGVLPLAVAGAANGLFAPESKGVPIEKRASDIPVFGSLFQKKYGGGDSDAVYQISQEALDARRTLNDMLKAGRKDAAKEYQEENRDRLMAVAPANAYRQVVGRINLELRRLEERNDLNGAEKAARREQLEAAKQAAATRFLTAVRRIEEGRTTPQ
jgi:hypothetical protein